MPVYDHFQQAKKAETLPDEEKLGACLTCIYWKAETPRPTGEVQKVAVCIQPQLKPFALIVSGSSGCNKWQLQPEAGQEARQYAEQGQ